MEKSTHIPHMYQVQLTSTTDRQTAVHPREGGGRQKKSTLKKSCFGCCFVELGV